MRVTNDRKDAGQRKKRDGKRQHTSKPLADAVHGLNETMKAMDKQIVFSIISEEGSRVVLMMDSKRNTVIRKIPEAELLEARVGDLLGVIVDRDG